MKTAIALHHACANGAPKEHIDAILFGKVIKGWPNNEGYYIEEQLKNESENNNEGQCCASKVESSRRESFISDVRSHDACLKDSSFDDESQSPNSHQSISRSLGSSVTLCLYDGEERLDFSSSKHSRSHEDDDLSQLVPLTSEALIKKNEIENDLIAKRERLWAKHAPFFSKLKSEINEILEERNILLKEFEKKEDELFDLRDQYEIEKEKDAQSLNESNDPKKSIVERIKLKLSMKMKKADTDVQYDIGMASTHLKDMERYYYELEENHLQLKRKYKSRYNSIFYKIDRQIEVTLCIRVKDPKINS